MAQDIRTLDLSAYRSKLGIVTQSPFLFDGTVRDNIRYGRAGCDRCTRSSAPRGRSAAVTGSPACPTA